MNRRATGPNDRPGNAKAKPRILIVEDEPQLRALLRLYLEREGYAVADVGDGASALAAYDAQPPDLVILDLMMPGMNGWAVLERMRLQKTMPPVVVLTAHGSYEAFTRVVREGVAGYISKPFSLDELLLTCAKALSSGALPAQDRRTDPRRPLVVRVRIMGPDAASLAVGELVNLSAQGGQVDLAVPLQQGERVRLTFDIPGGGTPMVLDAAVEWQQAGEGRYLHGLVFRELTPEAEAELAELLKPAQD